MNYVTFYKYELVKYNSLTNHKYKFLQEKIYYNWNNNINEKICRNTPFNSLIIYRTLPL